MKNFSKALSLCFTGLLLSVAARGEDRLTLTANGSTLTGTDGGAGGSISWGHSFKSNVVLGVGAEYQTLEDADWQFGSLSAAWTGGGEGRKWSLYGEGHKGNGEDNDRDFTYQVGAVGVILPLHRKLSLQLEDRQIDIDTTHGNLPKIGLSLLWTPRLHTAVSHARSVGGNLGTEVSTVRLDYYGQGVHFILGGAFGPADTVVLNLPPGVDLPSRSLREGFIGVARLFSRSEILLLGDYIKLGDSEKATLTLSYTLHLNRPKAAQ